MNLSRFFDYKTLLFVLVALTFGVSESHAQAGGSMTMACVGGTTGVIKCSDLPTNLHHWEFSDDGQNPLSPSACVQDPHKPWECFYVCFPDDVGQNIHFVARRYIGPITQTYSASYNKSCVTIPPPPKSNIFKEWLGCVLGKPRWSITWGSSNNTLFTESFEVERLSGTSWLGYFEGGESCSLFHNNNLVSTQFKVRAVNSSGFSDWEYETLPSVNCSSGGGPID